jgi:3-methyladenine DNA glycosylase AlkD
MTSGIVKRALARLANKDKARILARFFKTGPGQYGAGDKFLGITVPAQRQIAKQFQNLPLSEVAKLLASPIHEHRLTALLILVDKFQAAAVSEQQKIVKLYLSQTKFINNWDLVDLSAPKILGEWLVVHPDKKLLERLAKSKNLWEKRIAMLATFAFIKQKQLRLTFDLAKQFLNDRHDLIHKASGWMLREAGQRDLPGLQKFLKEHKHKMPRTMLRYAIEKFSATERKKYRDVYKTIL